MAENRTDPRKIIYNEQINRVNERQVEAASRELLIFNVCATEYAYLVTLELIFSTVPILPLVQDIKFRDFFLCYINI